MRRSIAATAGRPASSPTRSAERACRSWNMAGSGTSATSAPRTWRAPTKRCSKAASDERSARPLRRSARSRSAGSAKRKGAPVTSDSSRWVPQPRTAGVSYISADVRATLDLSESRVHGLADDATWDMATSLGLSPQLTTGSVLIELVGQGHDIVVCTADLGRPTQVVNFGRKHPDRYFNFGIAERNMIGAAAGLATTGHLPVISNYSFFLALMGVENIRNDICYPGLNVRMIGTHSGIAMGYYGTSHHCNEDIGALRAIAGLTLMAPCDGQAIRSAFTHTITHAGPIYFRAGRGREK